MKLHLGTNVTWSQGQSNTNSSGLAKPTSMEAARIKKIGEKWDFLSEADLEDFVWKNLPQLLHIRPLARQHFPDSGNRLDILGLNLDRSLSIIELKLGTDDGIISQLTRYHESIRHQNLFPELIENEKPISLIAISKDFHRNSLIDAKYSQLNFQLLTYKILSHREKLYFQLFDYSSGEKLSECFIEASEMSSPNCSPPPRMLKKLLEHCSGGDRESLLEARTKILAFDYRIQESIKQGTVTLSRGKSLPLAEFKYDKERESTFLYLFLPFQKPQGRRIISRVRAKIWLSGQTVTDVGFILHPRMNPVTHMEWIQGKKFCQEKAVVKTWIKHRVVSSEEDLTKPQVRRHLLDNYNWGNAEWGLALPMNKYEEHLKIHKILRNSATCQTLSEITDLALDEFAKKVRA